MRKLHLLSTVAASLLLATGVAVAQGMKDETPARAPAAQQNAPAEKMAPTMRAGEHKGKAGTTGQASEKMNAGKGNKAESKSNNKSETTGQAPKASESGKAETNEMGKSPNSHKTMKNSTDSKSGVNENTRSSGGSQRSSESVKSKSTVGQGAAAGSAKISAEQRTKITTVLRQHKVQPEHLSISVHVGARVPDTVHFYPLPTEVVEIYPEWRGYDYILVGDEILVVNPRTHLIIAVLEA